MGGGSEDGGGKWAAGGELYLSIGPFVVTMSPRSASHRPNPGGPKRCLTNTG